MIEIMRRMRGVILIACLAGLLTVPAVAGAVILTPPGKAGTNQYYEDVPSAQGPAAPPAGASSGPSTGATARTIDTFGGRRAIARLNHMGKTGRAVASLAATGAAATVATGNRRGSRASSAPAVSGSAVSGLSAALGGGTGGIGLLMPLLLIAIPVAALLGTVLRARGRSGPAA